jgi:hypothetical protein
MRSTSSSASVVVFWIVIEAALPVDFSLAETLRTPFASMS